MKRKSKKQRLSKRDTDVYPKVVYIVWGQLRKKTDCMYNLQSFWSKYATKTFIKLLKANPQHKKYFSAYEIEDCYALVVKNQVMIVDTSPRRPIYFHSIAFYAKKVFQAEHANFGLADEPLRQMLV